MKQSKWNIKIPTYVGIVLLALILGITIIISKNNSLNRLQAVPSSTPVSIAITNINISSFSISYTTSEPTTGVISFGETNSVGQIVLDDKDSGGSSKPHTLHYFSIKNLKPDTKYYFNILSDNTVFNNNGAPYDMRTAPVISANTQTARTVRGTILLPDGSKPKEAAAFLKIQNSQTLSTTVLPDGTYIFNLNTLRSDDLTRYITISDFDSITLSFTGDGRIASATVLVKDATEVAPVSLSQIYNFTADVPTPTTSASQSAKPTIPKFTKIQSTGELTIIIPEKNQPFYSSSPEFSGTALPKSSVNVVIQAIEEIKATIQADSEGIWIYKPDQRLEPGVYTLTITGKDKNGRTQSVSESFVMYAEGSQFTDPSVAPEKSPTPSVSPTPPASATPIPTVFMPSPTLISSTPTPILTNIVTNIPSPHPSLKPGSSEVIISIGLLTFATLVSAMLFLLFRV